MVAVQCSMSVKDAFVMMRSHAYVTGIRLDQLAERVLMRETRFDPSTDTWRDDLRRTELCERYYSVRRPKCGP